MVIAAWGGVSAIVIAAWGRVISAWVSAVHRAIRDILEWPGGQWQ